MINQKCMPRPKIIDVNTNDPVCYPYSIKVNKCSGTWIISITTMIKFVFLIDECTNTVEENNDILVNSSDDTIYFNLSVVLLILFLISISFLIYFYWYKRKNTIKSTLNIKFGP